jgi:branched-chain amino acid transport system ATP-binding protein
LQARLAHANLSRMAALLELEGVTRRFGGITAVSGVSLEVAAGEIVGLIGPNGAGKTTLFNLVTRLYDPDDGDIRLGGETLLRTPPHAVAARGIARTFQNVELFGTLSVLENVVVGAHSRTGWRDDRAARARALEILDYVGLAAIAHRPAAGFPFALLKRIELARALAAGPRLLLLDEPASGLSFQEVEQLVAFLRRLRDDFALTLFLVEHHMNLVMRVSDTVHVLDFGRRIASGSPEVVRANPAVVEAYLGTDDAAA